MGAAVFAFEQVSKVYPAGWLGQPRPPAVAEVTLRIDPGEVFGLIGPNRAGKTTLVKLLLSLCRPTSGSIERLGRPSSDRSTLARVGYVHENHAFPRYLSASALLHFYGALSLMPQELVCQRVPELLKWVDLADRAEEPVAQFSKGMVQRLGLAQALLNQPDLLVLDEPAEGLDLAGRRLVRDTILEQRRRGGSVLLVTHALSDIEELCDRVGVLVAGRLVHEGPPAGLCAEGRTLEQALQRLYEGGTR